MIATNDEATGMLVDALSHSPLWASTLIIVTEDDPANGGDHIDHHRTPVLFASPGLLFDPRTPTQPQLLPFSEDHVNALVDGTTVVTGRPFGPKVNAAGKFRPFTTTFAVMEAAGRAGAGAAGRRTATSGTTISATRLRMRSDPGWEPRGPS